MLLISLDSERSLVSVPEQIDMKDFSEVSEEDPMLNNSISTSGWGSWRDWNDRSSAGSEAESLKSAKLRVDEAFLDYTIAENAALKLQRSFRLKKREQELLVDVPLKDGRGAADDDSNDPNKVSEGDDEPTDRSSWYALLFLGLFGLLQTIATCGNTCFMNSDRLDPNTVPMDGAVNGAPAGNGGGGGGGAPPPGLEAMAGQAAGAASSSAGAGASAGAAAGATAGAAGAAGGAAGATAAAAGATTQVVAVVAVSSAVATVATTSGILTPASPAEVILSKCGLVNPQNRIGKFAMVFEGFARTLDDRESNILEGLVLDAYNDITFGSAFNVTGNCSDPLSREMEEINILNQTFVPLIEGGLDGSSYLEILFETKINEKEQDEPSSGQQPEQKANGTQMEGPSQNSTRLLRKQGRLLEDIGQDLQGGEQFQDTFQDLIEDELASFDVSGADFFQELIQRVVFETEALSLIGELPTDFVSVAQAYVTPTPRENGVEVEETGGSNSDTGVTGGGEGSVSDTAELFTQVRFQKQGDKAVFEFTFVDEETQETVQETVVVNPSDPNLVPVPTTSLPTFAPTKNPTISPSTNPTILFSGQPTQLPSQSPSLLPTVVASENPSSVPSPSPSAAPSRVPTISPSTHPTINFSGQPTRIPSKSPSLVPSESPTDKPSTLPSESPSETPSATPSFVPSMVPSFVPSMIPSTVPSSSPSDVPSLLPSSSPSDVPSSNPSGQPSMIPSFVPSMKPSTVPSTSPSDVPSGLPSSSPSDVPSLNPSSQPSGLPSASPSKSPTRLPSASPSRGPTMLPSASPSSLPSASPSSSPTRLPSASPSKAPTMLPSASPSKIPTKLPSAAPSKIPTASPSNLPSSIPSISFSPTSTPPSIALVTSSCTATQSSTYGLSYGASKAVNGNRDGNASAGQSTHTLLESNPWWQVDLGSCWSGNPATVEAVSIWNRSDCCWERLYGAYVQLIAADGTVLQQQQVTSDIGSGGQTYIFSPSVPNVYKIRVTIAGTQFLQLGEVEATGYIQG
ncbi:MAG: hypothetical protein SGBAC_011492 [Bacillariaceae sp.]